MSDTQARGERTDFELAVGQIWRHKREPWRKVEIFHIYTSDGSAAVRRNTSRRKQAISPTTLRRNYQLDRGS